MVGSEASMQSCHIPHYLFGSSTIHQLQRLHPICGFLEAGLLNLDRMEGSLEDVAVIGLSSTFQNGGVTGRYWMYFWDTRGNRRTKRGTGKLQFGLTRCQRCNVRRTHNLGMKSSHRIVKIKHVSNRYCSPLWDKPSYACFLSIVQLVVVNEVG